MSLSTDNNILISTSRSTRNTPHSSSVQYLGTPSAAKPRSSPTIPEGVNGASLLPYGKEGFFLISSDCIYLCRSSGVVWKCHLNETFSCITSCRGYILAGDTSGKLHIWDSLSGEKLGDKIHLHHRSITSLDQNGDFLVSGAQDGMVHLFGITDLIGGEAVDPLKSWSEHSLPVSQVAIVKAGQCAVSVGKDAVLVVMELFSGATLVRVIMSSPLLSVAVDIEMNWVYSGAENGTIYSLDLSAHAVAATSKHAKVITHPDKTTEPNPESLSELKGHETQVTSLQLLPHESTLLSGDNHGFVRVWDTETRTCTRVLTPWNKSGAGESHFPISQILILGKGDDAPTKESMPPLQRFTKKREEGLDAIVLPSGNGCKRSSSVEEEIQYNMKRYRLISETRDYYNRPQKQKEETPIEDDAMNTDEKTVEQLKEELAQAQSTIARWENVNNKLMEKLKAQTEGNEDAEKS